jgi:hypothetical protein
MQRNLKELLMKFYDCRLYLETAPVELEELKRNPVNYNGSTDIDHMQQVLNYLHRVYDLYDGIRNAKTHLGPMTADILDILTSIGVPHDMKIPIAHNEFARLYFWYDDDGEVNYELAV